MILPRLTYCCRIASLAVLIGCRSDDVIRPTDDFGFSHVSRVQGRVQSADGTPLDSVRVFVSVEDGRALYGSPAVVTGEDGTFAVTVTRGGTVAALPDTITATIRATSLRRSAPQVGLSSTVPVTLRFTPKATSATPLVIDLTVKGTQ